VGLADGNFSRFMAYFKHEKALVESESIGDGTRVWANAHILAGATVGRDCNICEQVFLEGDVVVGDRVTIKNGVQLWNGTRIEDDVFIGPNATFTNDPYPRSKHPTQPPQTVVKRGASIGANATLLPGVKVGELAMIGAGAVLTHDAPPRAKLVGNPARIIGYVDVTPETSAAVVSEPGEEKTSYGEVTVFRMPRVEDLRGSLTFGEARRQVPFEIKRYFLVFDVADENIRGEHAHRTLHQFLVCVAGRCQIVTDDGQQRHEFLLDSPAKALHIPPMVWGTQYRFSRDAILLVLASDYYDAAEYIRNYDEFLALRKQQGT
jgi:acetyltransferase-like isoleucine patch superfamily enzyme/dTDP-4-dehydrorhamnose 3,5-epimerase-like enzyme